MKTRHLLILCFSVMAISSCGHRTSNNNTQGNLITEVDAEPSDVTEFEFITEASPTEKRTNFSITREDLQKMVEYGEILDMSPSEGCAIIETEEGLKWFSTRLETLIDFPYDFMSQIIVTVDGNIAVEQDEKCGLMSTDGTEVVPCKYDDISVYGKKPYAVREDGLWGFLGNDGSYIIPPTYEMTHGFSGGLANVELNGKWGYINTNGETVIPFIYDYANDFDGFYSPDGHNGFATVKKNGKYGVVDIENKEVIPIEYESIYKTALEYDKIYIVVKDNKYGLKNLLNDNIDLPYEYDYIDGNTKEDFRARKDGKWGYINKTTGEPLSPFKYIKLGNLGDLNLGIAYEEENKPLAVNEIGTTFHELPVHPWSDAFRDLSETFHDGLARFKEKKGDDVRFGYVSQTGRVVIRAKYSYAQSFSGGFARVCANGKWGYIDTDGNEYPALTKSTSDRSWIYGTWVPVSNSVSTSDGSFYVVKNVIVSIDKDHIYLSDGNIHYEGSYTANDDEISLGGGKHVSIDGETLTYFGGMFMPVSVEMKKTSNSTTVASQVQEQRSRITFRSQEDVFGYLDFTSFKGNGSTVKIRRDCIYVNERGISGAPRVVSVSGSTAILSFSSVYDGGRTRQVYVYGDEKKIYFPDTRETFYE